MPSADRGVKPDETSCSKLGLSSWSRKREDIQEGEDWRGYRTETQGGKKATQGRAAEK